MRALIDENRDEFYFIALMALLMLVAYVQTRGMMAESAIVPQFIIVIMALSLVGIFVNRLYGERIKELLRIPEASGGFDFDTGDAEDIEDMYEINLVGVLKEFVWLGAYIIGIVYIGFFTVTFVFSVAYILVNESSSSFKRRLVYSVLWTGGIMALLYVLFVYFLRVSSVWRLGFLP